MLKITIDNKTLKNAMSVACLATETSESSITGHCLFEFQGKTLKILSTDKRHHLAQSIIGLQEEMEGSFTVDPRKILTLIDKAESDSIGFEYIPEKSTLQVFMSETSDSYVSLPSFEPKTYSPIGEVFTKTFDLKTINAGVLLGGVQFIKGFLDPKNKNFSNLYISNGVFYGSNGNNLAAAFSCPDLAGLDELVIPNSTIQSIGNMIGKLDLQDIIIQTTSNNILFSSSDKNHTFGFTKVNAKMPKIPISIKDPEGSGWTFNKNILLKKLSCFHVTGDANLGVKGSFSSDSLQLLTVYERSSKDSMACKKIAGDDVSFVTQCRLLEIALKQFGGSELNIFVNKKIILHSKAEFEITEKDNKILKPFTSAAAIALFREEK